MSDAVLREFKALLDAAKDHKRLAHENARLREAVAELLRRLPIDALSQAGTAYHVLADMMTSSLGPPQVDP